MIFLNDIINVTNQNFLNFFMSLNNGHQSLVTMYLLIQIKTDNNKIEI